jgi:hypothetical protein
MAKVTVFLRVQQHGMHPYYPASVALLPKFVVGFGLRI